MVLGTLVWIALVIIVIIVIVVLLRFLFGVLFVLPVAEAEASFWSTRDGTNYSTAEQTSPGGSKCSIPSTNTEIPMPLPKMR